jgi:hypothetical protein
MVLDLLGVTCDRFADAVAIEQTKLGKLKELTTRLFNTSVEDADELRSLVGQSLLVLERAYNTSGIVPPRRGKGAFKSLQPLRFTAIHYGTRWGQYFYVKSTLQQL